MSGSTIARVAGWLLLPVLVACGESGDRTAEGAAESVPEAERYGGTAVMSYSADIQSLGVLHTRDHFGVQLQRDVLFMPLVRYDADLEPRPWLAERWETRSVAPDSLELTFHLRRDVRWHDGTPTTAADVRYTFERIKDPSVAAVEARRFEFYNPTVEVPDSYTVRFRLRAHAEYLEGWYTTPPLPAHLLSDVPPEQLATHPFGTREPVGNGPFRFAGRTPGEGWTFDANADFPAALGGRPYLDRVVVRVSPEPTTQVVELSTGAADIAYVGAAQVDQLSGTGGVRVVDFAMPVRIMVLWNTRLPQFADARVRRALTLALDRPAITQVVLNGRGLAGHATVTPFHWAFDPGDTEARLPHDPALARRLLAEAGWQPGSNGVLRDPEGRAFHFTLAVNSANRMHQDAAQVMQAQLRPLGVQMEIRQMELNTLLQQAADGGASARPLDAMMMGFVDGIRQDDSHHFHSRHVAGPSHLVGYSNPRLDALLDSLAESADREAARPLWKEYQRLIAQEAPATVVYYPRGNAAVSTRLQGTEIDARGLLNAVTRWWIAPAKR